MRAHFIPGAACSAKSHVSPAGTPAGAFFCGRLQPPGRTGAGGWAAAMGPGDFVPPASGEGPDLPKGYESRGIAGASRRLRQHNLASNLIIILIIAVDFSCGLLYNVARFRNTSREMGICNVLCKKRVTEDLTLGGAGMTAAWLCLKGYMMYPRGCLTILTF